MTTTALQLLFSFKIRKTLFLHILLFFVVKLSATQSLSTFGDCKRIHLEVVSELTSIVLTCII